MAEINRKSVLLECLELMREELRLSSRDYNGLVPADRMEESWEQARRKVEILEELIHAYDSEPVRVALADWQKEVMQEGPPKSIKFDGEDEVMAIHEGRSAESNQSDYPKES